MTVKKGDVFVASWGYDQTNIDYEQVIGVTKSGKSVYVKPIENAYVGEGPRRRVVADVGNFRTAYALEWVDGEMVRVEKDTTRRRLIQSYDNTAVFPPEPRVYIKWTSFANAYLVDPTVPQFDTIAAGGMGH